jgi:hypothetical protein
MKGKKNLKAPKKFSSYLYPMFKTYRKTATVSAKLFEKGDEDGFATQEDPAVPDLLKNQETNCEDGRQVPFIATLENQRHFGRFGQYYICHGPNNDRWLVEKGIFEGTYELAE